MSRPELAGAVMAVFVVSCGSGTAVPVRGFDAARDECADDGGCAAAASVDAANGADGPGHGVDAAAETGNTVDAGDDAGACFPNHEGVSGGALEVDLTVDDTGFSKRVVTSSSDGQITLTLTNTGTKLHGFTVGCTSVPPLMNCLPCQRRLG